MVVTFNEVRQIFAEFDPNNEIVVSKGKLGIKTRSSSLIGRFLRKLGFFSSKKCEVISKAAAEKILHVAAESKATLREIKDLAGFKALQKKLIKECCSGKESVNTGKVTVLFQQVFGRVGKDSVATKPWAAKFEDNFEPKHIPVTVNNAKLMVQLGQLNHAFGVAGAAYQIDEQALKLMQQDYEPYIEEFFPKDIESGPQNHKGLQERVFDFMQELAEQRAEVSRLQDPKDSKIPRGKVQKLSLSVSHKIHDDVLQARKYLPTGKTQFNFADKEFDLANEASCKALNNLNTIINPWVKKIAKDILNDRIKRILHFKAPNKASIETTSARREKEFIAKKLAKELAKETKGLKMLADAKVRGPSPLKEEGGVNKIPKGLMPRATDLDYLREKPSSSLKNKVSISPLIKEAIMSARSTRARDAKK